MKAILATLVAGILVAGIQQYRIATRDSEIATLEAAVEAHNNATVKLADDSKLENTEAAGRVTAVLLEAEKTKRTLPNGSGHVVMNQFMQAVFE